MHQELRTDDVQLRAADVRQLENAQQVVHFFARLRYDVDGAMQLNHEALGLDRAELRHLVHDIHLVATDAETEIRVYLMKVRSVTVRLKQLLARGLRDFPSETLLVLTSDYEKLDFVLLQKDEQPSKALGKPLRLTIRPRTVTVNRRHPDAVALRVLRRLTYTEDDYAAQWDKLRSAFTLAEWSEQYFNNRALFADYYLKQRLTDPDLRPEWGEDVLPIGRELMRLLARPRHAFSGEPESTIRRQLYEPLFASLGFRAVRNKAGTSTAEEPDYYLYAPQPTDGSSISNLQSPISDHPLAAVLTYVWNRNLDMPDYGRDRETPDEIPGALVVSVLEKGEVPWVIVTNGKLWRLYAAGAGNKATNYYEVDLEEALNDQDDTITALKYWWLFFRRQAFEGFLADVLQASSDYAKALGERLKDRIFEEIFPHFAAGFLANQPLSTLQSTDSPVTDQTFTATMTFLYRLMFILYAESLELLPVYEERGYQEHSLHRLKNEIAEAAGNIEDEAPERLRKAYSATSTDLYKRLQELFQAIDQGREAWNLPVYNGGLFSPDTPEGQYLQAQAIPDHFLALGLDRLARDVDEKSQALVMIDYKDLGVRHLGSIYEGLLEFKLRVAQEKLAIVRQKGREVYIPVAEISKSRRTYGEIAKGEVYLENDKRERKATGSYYTPDYIVKYIVEHTVGPVLERKFDELEPRLREAQRRYRQHKKRVEARGNDQPPELWWKDDDEAQRLADDCLNLRCLDPAMGSGHFLVEVVDFVSNRLLDFLNAWSENPVWAMLERMREEILADVEAQGVSIDAGKLTRVALLKRAVLKRCIYGVDLNEMAVELAKVSLWLDAFTLGAPLSFLDHHLKQGNSLIGARVKEVQDALEGKANQAVQMSLFGTSKFAGVMLATELMRQVSYLSDNTVAQVQESRKAYRDARDQLAPFKRILDVYTSRWFGNEPGKGGFDPTIEFLQREDTQRWLEDLETPLPEKDYLNVGQVAETALEAAEEKRFFHWELEFPEVFFAPRTRDGQDVELLEDGGFDAVVGNPPYDELSEDALGRPIDEREYLTNASIFEPAQASGGRLNWYHFFMVLGIRLLKPRGRASFIVPMSWMGDSFTFGVRKWLLSHHVPIVVEAFPQKDNPYERVFFEAKLPTSIFIAEKNNVSKSISVRVHPGRDILSQPHYQADLSIIKSLENWIIPLVSRREWDVLSKLLSDDGLGTIADDGAEPTSGEIIFNKATRPYLTDDGAYDLILRGSHVQRYELASKAKQGEPVYLKKAAYLKDSQDGSKAFAHQQPRVVYQEGSAIDAWRRVVPTYLPAGYICGHKICYFTDYKVDHLTLLAIFGSNLINWLVERLSTTNSLPAYLIGNLPFPRFHDTQDASNQRAIIEAIRHSYRANNYDAVLQDLKNSLTPNNIAITHDALSFLAQMMIELNQEKQQEASRFISWLEKVLQILPRKGKTGIEALTGYTIIQNYLGDYQKGEKELPWSEMEYRLYSNRSRFQANWEKVKGQVQTEYEKSLETLRPIKQQLAETDALIDKIVYKLYGLTDEEIALIEQPQYEQALQEAKEAVRGDKKLQKDPDKAADVIAEKVLPAAERFQQRVAHDEERRRLDRDLPGWHMFPADVQTFLLTGEYNIRSLPDHLDFSASVISYAKAVETVLFERLFVGFRDAARDGGRQTADGNVRNKFLKEFVEGTRRHLTLGSMAIILSSSKEKALRAFALATFPVGEERLFGDEGVAGLLNDDTVIHLRNKAAHDEVLTKEEAKMARAWAVGVLGNL